MINLQLTNSEAIALEMLLAMVRVIHSTPDMKPELILQLLKVRCVEDIQAKLSERLNEVQVTQAIANSKV